jgi:hypothetical protein
MLAVRAARLGIARRVFTMGGMAAAIGCAQGSTASPNGIETTETGDSGATSTEPEDASTTTANQTPPEEDAGGSNVFDGGGGSANEDARDEDASVGDDDAGIGGEDAGSGPESGITVVDSGGSTGSGTAPTTCSQADGKQGCCVGNELYYCASSSSSLTKTACSSGEVCGWSASSGYYDCVSPPASADPSGTYPIACP